jgi:hypothetical protein
MSGARISNWDGGSWPWSSVLTESDPTETDHRTVTIVLGKKPVPDTVTMVPGGPMFGVSTRWGTAGRAGRDGGWCGAVITVVGGGGVAVFVGGGVVVADGVGGVVVVEDGGGFGAEMGTETEVLAEKLAFRYGVLPLVLTVPGEAKGAGGMELPAESVSVTVTAYPGLGAL